MKNIMIDLETMGNGSNAAIISIGAVYFDETGLGNEFYKKISLESSVAAGLEMDADTVLWWMNQHKDARKEFEEKGDPLFLVMKQLANFIEEDCCIWGNGAAFDNVILKNAFQKCNISIPWKFSNDRCFRTLKNLFPGVEIPKNNCKHNALEDAKWQANYALKVLDYLKSPAPMHN